MLNEEGFGMEGTTPACLSAQLVPVMRMKKKVGENLQRSGPIVGHEFTVGVVLNDEFQGKIRLVWINDGKIDV